MKEKMMHLLSKSVSVLLIVALIATVSYTDVSAAGNLADNDPVIVVSLGDSYSSGEGVPPFYGQNQNIYDKVQDDNWLAHRSEDGWPGQIEVPEVNGKMRGFRAETTNSTECKWYFRASSGATTTHFFQTQKKEYTQFVVEQGEYVPTIKKLSNSKKLPPQLQILRELGASVDYVTFTLGGNDMKFADVIYKCVMGVPYLGTRSLKEEIDGIWQNYGVVEGALREVYDEVANAAPNAQIVVAGYPKLMEQNGKGPVFEKDEAALINANVTKFNKKIRDLVTSYSDAGKNFIFVDVETSFNGHEAYSDDPWINPVWPAPKDQDIDQLSPGSKYSMHPNAKGCEVYARCVSDAIDMNRAKGTLSGKICHASDRSSPIANANINAELLNSRNSYGRGTYSNDTGNYSLDLMKGEYSVKISAPGFIPFTAYADVQPNTNNYMETYLLVQGEPGETGVASGKVTNAMTGSGVADVALTVREGWNNTTHGDVAATAATASDGSYSLSLPIGNYTVYAEKGGYIAASFNIIVQPGTTGSQNGTISPVVSGDSFRAVLTWGENPSDLDSHVVGTLSGGDQFHVYYSHKSQYDGDIEVCNLDVDDTTSYGPETTTLNLTTDQPYYYYIYRYAGSGTVASSGAQIKLYQGENLVATFNVPTDQGSGDYWNVFAIVNGELVVRNTITGSADVSYVP